MAEGYEGIIRVYSPSFLAFTDGDTFTSNYTTANATVNATCYSDHDPVTNGYRFDHVDFIFNTLNFPDVIELNFTMTVDPTELKAVGSGLDTSPVTMKPLCKRRVVDSFPATVGEIHSCGASTPVEFTSRSFGKESNFRNRF